MSPVYKLISSEGNIFTFEETSHFNQASVYLGVASPIEFNSTIQLVIDNPPPLVHNSIIKFFTYIGQAGLLNGQKESTTTNDSGESNTDASTTTDSSGSTVQSDSSSSASTDSTIVPAATSGSATTISEQPATISKRPRPITTKSDGAAASS